VSDWDKKHSPRCPRKPSSTWKARISVGLGQEAFAALSAQAELDLESAETAAVVAEAERMQAQANLASAEADLEHAAGERELKRGQVEALTLAAEASARTVETSNRLITLWGVSFPALPPVYLAIGAAFGVLIGGFGGYSFGVSKALTPRPPETEVRVAPEPDVIGA